MEIKVSYLLIGATAAYSLTLVPGLAQKYEQSQLVQAASVRAKFGDSQDLAVAKDAQKRSEVALERVKAGCYPVTTQVGSKTFEAPLVDETPVVVAGINSPLGHGSFVCNGQGETGVVVMSANDKGEPVSVITAIAKASIADLPAYKQWFAARAGAPQPIPSPSPTATATTAPQKKANSEVVFDAHAQGP